MERFEKMKIALRYYLYWKQFNKALEAFEFWLKHHKWTRKDWVTPEFHHQIEICHYLITLKWLWEFEEQLLVAALLHDIREDYWIEHFEIEDKFWRNSAETIERLTKKFKWTKKAYEDYFEELSKDLIASIVKWADRVNNAWNMVWVFNKEKQLSYVNEIEVYFLPMLKQARRNFPNQAHAYFNIETVLAQQVKFVRAMFNT